MVSITLLRGEVIFALFNASGRILPSPFRAGEERKKDIEEDLFAIPLWKGLRGNPGIHTLIKALDKAERLMLKGKRDARGKHVKFPGYEHDIVQVIAAEGKFLSKTIPLEKYIE
jgi:hypothetical protein